MSMPDERHQPLEVASQMTDAHVCQEWSTRWLSTIGILSFLAALVVTVLVVAENSMLLAVDEWTNSTVNDWARGLGWPVQIADWIGMATSPVPSVLYGMIAIVGFALARRRRWAILVAGAGIAGVTISEAFKLMVDRPRPPGAAPYVAYLDKSFPSGHTAAGIYLYVCLAVILILLAKSQDRSLLHAVGIVLFSFGILIGVSRLVLGVHLLSDVVAGWLFGSATLLVALALTHPECQVSVRSTTELDQPAAHE